MLLILVVVLVSVVIYYHKRNVNDIFWKQVMAIPGPKCLPIVGTEFHLDTSEESFNRDRALGKQFYPIYKTFTFGTAFVNLIHPDDIELVLNNTKHIEKSALYKFLQDWLGFGLITNKGQSWHTRRKILTPAFHFIILQEFVEIFNRETNHLVQYFKDNCQKPYIDVTGPILEFTLYSIGETSFGKDLREIPKCKGYKQAVHDYGEEFIYRMVRPWLHIPFLYNLSAAGRKNKKIVTALHDFSRTIVDEKMKNFSGSDKISYSKRKKLALLDLLLKYKNDGADINEVQIREEVDTFILAGHDTTAVALTYILMLLANEQEIQEKIYEEITSLDMKNANPTFVELGLLKYMERCIKECLRIYPSVPVISRVAGEDIKTKTGYTIPKGCNIGLFIIDTHMSPEFWDNPEKFDPDRFSPENCIGRHPYSYIPFSAGSRNCIGQRYAMLELKAALCGILKAFKLEPVSKRNEATFKSSLVLRPATAINVKFVLRE